AGLGHLHCDRQRQLEDVLISEEVHGPGALEQLAVIEGVIAGLPGNLGDVKVPWNSRFRAQPLQLRFRHWLALDADAAALEEVRVPAKAMVRAPGRLDLAGDVSRRRPAHSGTLGSPR